MRAASWVVAGALGLGGAAAIAQQAVSEQQEFPPPGVDKSQYHLFNPTPAALLRPLSTDRPDTTESPYTVDAGHVQVETSFFDYTRSDGGSFEAWSVLATNFKIGLTNDTDIQLVFEPYVREELDGDRASGLGVTQVRLKINLWGNDGGDTALAIMPFVQLPTSDDEFGATDHLEGGLIIPYAIALPNDWNLGLMAEFDAVRDSADDGYELQLVHTATVGRNITEALGGYVEYIGITDTEDGTGYVSLLGTGLTYGVNENVQLDLGINVGLSSEADDFNVFAGISVRR